MTEFEFTPFVWPFVASILTSVGLAIYAFRHQVSPAATTFAWMMVALIFWTFCYAMELVSATLEGKIFWAKMKYLGATSGPVLFFILALQLTNKTHWLTTAVKSLLFGWAIVTIFIVFTNENHLWYWTEIHLEVGFPETQSEHGFYFWIYAITSYLLILGSLVLYFDYFRKAPNHFRKQATLMALAGFIPLAGRILEDFVGVDIFPKVDNIILLLLLSAILFAVAIFKYRALDVVHIAHDLVIKNIQAGIVVLDNAARIVDLNPFALEMTQQNRNAIGQPFQLIFKGWQDVDLSGHSEKEFKIIEAAQERVFSAQVSPIKDAKEALVGHTIVLFDISARKKAEDSLMTFNRELEDSNQALATANEELEISNAELDAFAHTVAHDLKNPLSLIIGFSDLLQSDAEDLSGDDVQNSINTIKTTGQKMTNIIDELLLLASVRQKAEVETTPLDMSLIVAEAKSRLQQMIAKYEGQLVVADEWPTAVGYAPWVEEVWVNYISNALKYGGQPPHIELGATKDSVGQVCFWVKDNGAGLSEEEQAQLFTEFTRLHKTRAQGHGLGLSIVRRIVERLNGKVGIQQEPEGGTAFFFTLPKPPYLATE